jgi:hypothetical protein
MAITQTVNQLLALVVEKVHAAGSSGIALQYMNAASVILDKVEPYLAGVTGLTPKLFEKLAYMFWRFRLKVNSRTTTCSVTWAITAMGPQLTVDQYAKAAQLPPLDKALCYPRLCMRRFYLDQLLDGRTD